MDLALLVLRLTVGAIFIFHGSQKAFAAWGGPGFHGVVNMLGPDGLNFPLPEVQAALLVTGELGGGILLVLGFATRIGGVLTAIVMIVALLTRHRADHFAGLHAQHMLLAASVALTLAGAGRISVWPGWFRGYRCDKTNC